MKNFSVKVLCEIAIFAAIGFVLDILQGGIWKGAFANGGSIGLAMVPVFIISYRRGLVPGILCGLLLSLVQMLGGTDVMNASTGWKATFGPFIQIMLDYILAYTVCGVAGAFAGMYKNGSNKKKLIAIICGCVIAGSIKYALHVISGGLFWLGDGSGSFWGIKNDGWLYSFIYNGAYMIPNIIICTIIMVLIAKFYPMFIDVEINSHRDMGYDGEDMKTYADNASIETDLEEDKE